MPPLARKGPDAIVQASSGRGRSCSHRAGVEKEETMKRKFQEWLCYWFGHAMYSLYEIDNGQSKWGEHKCSRCGHKDSWQYDY